MIANLDTRLSTEIADVRTELTSLKTRLIRWMVGTVILDGHADHRHPAPAWMITVAAAQSQGARRSTGGTPFWVLMA